MIFSRSIFRATTAAQSFRAIPLARRSAQQQQQLSRRFYASGKGYEEHRSSNLPWLLGSIGIGGPVIVYLLKSGPVKKTPSANHGGEHGAGNEYSDKDEGNEEEQKGAVDEEKQSSKEDEDSSEQTAEQKQSSTSSSEIESIDEPRAVNPPADPNSMSSKQQNLSNADTMHPHMSDSGKSVEGEGEIETAKVNGTVSPQRPQQ